MIPAGMVYPFSPTYRVRAASSNTQAYESIGITASGTSGTTSLTASATVANLMFVGQQFQLAGTDTYTVAAIVTTAITTTTNLTTTYVASAITSPRISQIDDISGNDDHPVQSTSAQKPSYVASGPLNNKPAFGCIGVSGTGSYMTIANSTALQDWFQTGGTVALVFSARSIGGSQPGRFWIKGNTAQQIATGPLFQLAVQFSGTSGTFSTSITTNTNYVILITYSADATTNVPVIYLNSTTGANMTVTTTPVGTYGTSTGAVNYLNTAALNRAADGFLCEHIAWKQILNSNQITQVMKRLGAFYGVTIS